MGTHVFIHGLARKRWWRPREEEHRSSARLQGRSVCSAVPSAPILGVLLPPLPLHGAQRNSLDSRANTCSRKSKAQKAFSVPFFHRKQKGREANTHLRWDQWHPESDPAGDGSHTSSGSSASRQYLRQSRLLGSKPPAERLTSPISSLMPNLLMHRHEGSCSSGPAVFCVLSSCQKLLRTSWKRQLSSNSGKSFTKASQSRWAASLSENSCVHLLEKQLWFLKELFSLTKVLSRSFKCKW